MSTPASIWKHPIHPMLVAFPLGLWIFSLAAHIFHLAGGSDAWSTTATYSMGGGLVGAAAAAIPGLIDLLAIQPGRAKTTAIWHAVVNLTVLTIITIAFFLRLSGTEDLWALVLTAAGVALLLVGGWLGGHLVYVYGVGVEREHK